MAEVDLNVVCKHCGAEVSPYITECPYCGQRLRKRAPKLKQEGGEVAPRERRRLRLRPRPRKRVSDRPLAWLEVDRPFATIALVLAGAVVYILTAATNLSAVDLGAVVGELGGDWWRLVAAQFVYENVGYLLAVGVVIALFGSSLERRYGAIVTAAIFLGSGALAVWLGTQIENFPIVYGGNGAALGLMAAWTVRDLRDRRAGLDTETDLLGAGIIAAVIAVMPLLEPTASWAGLAGVLPGAVAGLLLPSRP